MADQKSSGSLADRVTKPADTAVSTDTSKSASKFSWADDASPSTPTQPALSDTTPKDQLDGAASDQQGSALTEPEYDVQVKLSDMQGDESSPLHSVTSFEDLGMSPEILKGIYSMNFKKPSKIQEKALPLLLRDPPRNMIAQSQSGTGKTAAFVLTILTRIDYTKPQQPQALCLAPSRELARQIEGVVRTIGQYVEGLTVGAAVPGANERGSKVQAMVICGTPGTVMDLVKRKQLDPSQMKILCLDEADNMLDQQGLGDQCMRVKQLMTAKPQILLFSATFPDRVMDYAQQFCPNPNHITLRHTELTVKGISQMYIEGPGGDAKYEILAQLYGLMTIGSSIIFVREKRTADRIAKKLSEHGHKCVAVHGEYDGIQRDEILSEFRNGNAKVLITTNVLARGIDVQTVSMVINYDIPMIYDAARRKDIGPDYETYLHRIGRTGRFGRVGVSISFVFNKSEFQALSSIAQHYGIDLTKLDSNDWDRTEETVKAIVKSSRAGQNMKNE